MCAAALQLDDHIVKTQTMKSNTFIGPFEERTLAWEKTLMYLQDMLDMWLKVQATWMYLEPIFGSEDIQKQMPVEGKMFKTCDTYFKDIMASALKDVQVTSGHRDPEHTVSNAML
jgi:dynein heavy chain